jgi:lysyl-tRNA synthetase class 2
MSVKEKEVSTEHQIRKSKVHKLEEQGLSAWPDNRPITTSLAEAKEHYVPGNEEEREECLAGRVISRRGHGKTSFAHIRDRSGTLQLYIKNDELSESNAHVTNHLLDIGDIVWVRGTLFVTRTGETSLKVHELVIVSKCLHPLPDKYHGLTDTEHRYRQRYLDVMVNDESRNKFIARSKIVESVRDHLREHEFLEVETPMLHPIPGGAAARPFTTHHNAYDMKLYMRIAPELYLKRLVVGGFDRVFEINRNFRNEGVSTRHNPEFTMLEFYMAYGSYADGMALTEGMLHRVAKTVSAQGVVPFGDHEIDFSRAFTRLTMVDSLSRVGGLSPDQVTPDAINGALAAHGREDLQNASYGNKVLALFELLVEPKLIQPTFITDFPIEISPLAKRRSDKPDVAARFELFVAGMELANGFSELNDPFDQAQRFHDQVAAREAGDDEAHYFDADYVRALEYGLPPTVGVGIGIDRLTMLMTNTTSIKDVILFPTMKRLASHEDE